VFARRTNAPRPTSLPGYQQVLHCTAAGNISGLTHFTTVSAGSIHTTREMDVEQVSESLYLDGSTSFRGKPNRTVEYFSDLIQKGDEEVPCISLINKMLSYRRETALQGAL